MEKCKHSVQVLRPTTINLYFSFLFIDNPKNSGVAIQNPVYLSPNEENTEYPELSHLLIILFLELKPIPNIQDWTMKIHPVLQIIQGIPHSYWYLLN